MLSEEFSTAVLGLEDFYALEVDLIAKFSTNTDSFSRFEASRARLAASPVPRETTPLRR